MAGFILKFLVPVADPTITLPATNNGTFDAVVDWGDSSTSEITSYNDADLTHNYSIASDTEFTVEISDDFPGFSFNGGGSSAKCTELVYCGDSADFGGFNFIERGFQGCANMLVNVNCGPLLLNSAATRLIFLFYQCSVITAFPQDLFENGQNVLDMRYALHSCVECVTPPSFRNFTSATTFAAAVFNCPKMNLPMDFFATPEEYATKFLNRTVDFAEYMRRASYVGDGNGYCPPLWLCDFGSGGAVNTDRILRSEIETEFSINNYNAIPDGNDPVYDDWAGSDTISNPVITNVSDNSVEDGQTIAVTGDAFCYGQVTFYLTDNSDWNSSTVFVEQTLNSGATDINANITIDFGTLSGTGYLHAEHYREQDTGTGGYALTLVVSNNTIDLSVLSSVPEFTGGFTANSISRVNCDLNLNSLDSNFNLNLNLNSSLNFNLNLLSADLSSDIVLSVIKDCVIKLIESDFNIQILTNSNLDINLNLLNSEYYINTVSLGEITLSIISNIPNISGIFEINEICNTNINNTIINAIGVFQINKILNNNVSVNFPDMNTDIQIIAVSATETTLSIIANMPEISIDFSINHVIGNIINSNIEEINTTLFLDIISLNNINTLLEKINNQTNINQNLNAVLSSNIEKFYLSKELLLSTGVDIMADIINLATYMEIATDDSLILIPEDGSIVEGANTYVTVVEAREYAAIRNLPLPDDDDMLKALLIISMDLIESYRNKYKGCKTTTVQNTQFPRENLKIDGILMPNDFIPKELKEAQIRLSVEQNLGIDIQPTKETGFVTEKIIGPITKKYSNNKFINLRPIITSVNDLLKPLFKHGSGLTTKRG